MPEGVLTAASKDDQAAMSNMICVGLNLATLPREILYQLQDEVITKLRTQEGCRGCMQAIENACRSVPELAVLAELPATKLVHKLAANVCEALEETVKVQLELNLQIVKLRLKAQPSTPPEVREQCTYAIQMGLEQIGQATQGCIGILEQALAILMHVQENPNL